jgi:diguanylate cyclase (GGDEF)-like protein
MKPGRLLQLGASPEVQDADHLRIRICLLSLYLLSIVLSVLLLTDLMTGNHQTALVNSVILFFILCIIADHYRSENFRRTGNAVIAALYLVLVTGNFMTDNLEQVMSWNFLFPVLAIMAKGGRIGLLNTLLFYSVIFASALLGFVDGSDVELIPHALALLTLAGITFYYDHIHQMLYARLSEQLAQERENRENLQELSTTDPMTGLRNRRNIEQVLTNEANRARRHGHYLGFFIFDIDHFKRYNDQLGQKMGDKALQSIGGLLKAGMRRSDDQTFRLGGEQFGGLVVVENRDQVMPQVEKLMRTIEAMGIVYPHEGEETALTVSAGVLITDGVQFDVANDILAAAESALYSAKRAGGNSAVLYRGG